ncbi:MAG: UDP-N-acetylmuramoyl-tripeptide--D-alanyl-D-alanine ligase, partial [Betaproteobacteria bacterium]|nr:UDP-N-acetylmuramoyl-tripeptide--D-alanyl-D-alanine ligase [Candidatus Fonsibacter lacus]
MIEPLSVSDFAQVCQGRYIPGTYEPSKIKGIAIDSRQVQKGDLFAALAGERVDGHAFAAQAANDGASAVLVERELDVPCAQIVVSDVRRAVGDFGRVARNSYQGVLVGVTGSAGKTTTKNLLHAMLKTAGNTLATAGNLNNELGVPLTLASLKPTTEFAVVEMGAGKPGDIGYLQSLVRPTVAVLLSVAPAHIEYFESLDAIASTKAAILDDLGDTGLAVINGDLPWSTAWAERAAPAKVVTFGFSKGVDVRAKEVQLDGFAGTRCKVLTPQGTLSLMLALPGRQGVANALAAIAVGISLGLSHASILRGLATVTPAAGRGAT